MRNDDSATIARAHAHQTNSQDRCVEVEVRADNFEKDGNDDFVDLNVKRSSDQELVSRTRVVLLAD